MAKAITNPNKCPYPLTKEEVKKYYEEGFDLGDISKIANTSRQRLARWMEYWGLPRRRTADAARLKYKRKTGRGTNWQGGRWYVKQNKTWFVYAPLHPRANHSGAVAEHILNAEKKAGRYMRADECSHHMFMDRDDNNNVILLTKSEHQVLHRVLGDAGINLIQKGHLDLVLDNCPEHSHELIKKVYSNEGT